MKRDPYFDIKALSNSDLKWFKKSPAHYKWYKENPPLSSKDQAIGTAAHTLILEANKFKDQYAVLDLEQRPEPTKTMASNENKAWLAAFNEENKDKEVITSVECEALERMRDAVHANGFAKELILDSQNQFEHVIQFEVNEIKCKGKLDVANPSFILDLKTTKDASRDAFQRDAYNYEYYRQAPFYQDGFQGDLPFPIPFYFVAVEKTPPYGVAVYKCSDELMNYGREEYRDLIEQYKTCLESGYWPGYNNILDDYFDLELPAWVNHKYA